MYKDFSGWSVEGWSLEHELLELRFHLWPSESDVEEGVDDQSDIDQHYRGKEIFSRPTRIVFRNFALRATVDKVVRKKGNKDSVVCRYTLSNDSFVEIEAESCVQTLW